MKTQPKPKQTPRDEATGRRGASSILASTYLSWIVAAVAVALAVVFAVLWQRSQRAEHRRAEVASVAGEFLRSLTNFTGQTIDRDVREIRSFAVGDFADQVETFFNRRAIEALRKANARSVGRIQKLFVESISGGTASVFGVVNESVTNRAQPTPRREVIRIEIEMIDTKQGWKVNSVDILQSPGATSPFGP